MVKNTERIDRILIVIPAQLGDVLLCTPLIRAARLRWPAARIDVLGYAGTLGLLAGNPDVSERIEVSRSQGLRAQLRQAARLWRRYDLALVGRTNDRAHLYGLVAARRRSAIVPDQGPGIRWKRWAADHALTQGADAHQVLVNLRLLDPWLDERAASLPVSLVPPGPQALPVAVVEQLAHPFVVVHVPSMWRYKQWPTAHYRHVVEALLAEGVQVVLTGSSSANDQALIAEVRGVGPVPALLDVSGQLTLSQLRSLLERADAYMGPDTSITHLATALDVPVVTVYGPTVPETFGPWPPEHTASQPWQRRAQRQKVRNVIMLQGPDLPGQRCVPCNRMGCENRHDSQSHCLEGLEPARVLDELRSLLRQRATDAA